MNILIGNPASIINAQRIHMVNGAVCIVWGDCCFGWRCFESSWRVKLDQSTSVAVALKRTSGHFNYSPAARPKPTIRQRASSQTTGNKPDKSQLWKWKERNKKNLWISSEENHHRDLAFLKHMLLVPLIDRALRRWPITHPNSNIDRSTATSFHLTQRN